MVGIPTAEGEKCFVLFSFHFQILHTKLGIFDFKVIFPPMISIVMEGEGDEIKLKQASKKDRTLHSQFF